MIYNCEYCRIVANVHNLAKSYVTCQNNYPIVAIKKNRGISKYHFCNTFDLRKSQFRAYVTFNKQKLRPYILTIRKDVCNQKESYEIYIFFLNQSLS